MPSIPVSWATSSAHAHLPTFTPISQYNPLILLSKSALKHAGAFTTSLRLVLTRGLDRSLTEWLPGGGGGVHHCPQLFLLYIKAELDNVDRIKIPFTARFCMDVSRPAAAARGLLRALHAHVCVQQKLYWPTMPEHRDSQGA